MSKITPHIAISPVNWTYGFNKPLLPAISECRYSYAKKVYEKSFPFNAVVEGGVIHARVYKRGVLREALLPPEEIRFAERLTVSKEYCLELGIPKKNGVDFERVKIEDFSELTRILEQIQGELSNNLDILCDDPDFVKGANYILRSAAQRYVPCKPVHHRVTRTSKWGPIMVDNIQSEVIQNSEGNVSWTGRYPCDADACVVKLEYPAAVDQDDSSPRRCMYGEYRDGSSEDSVLKEHPFVIGVFDHYHILSRFLSFWKIAANSRFDRGPAFPYVVTIYLPGYIDVVGGSLADPAAFRFNTPKELEDFLASERAGIEEVYRSINAS